MYYADLSPYSTCPEPKAPIIRTIGWLDRAFPYTKGAPLPDFAAKLHELVNSEYPHLFRFHVTRGYHYCEFCCDEEAKGGCELLVPDISAKNQFFAAPELVCHYVLAHGYQPPRVFVDSVLAIDLTQAFDAVLAYDELTMTVDKMRREYARRSQEYANYVEDSRMTERQRANFRRGEHLRYAKWLKAHPQ